MVIDGGFHARRQFLCRSFAPVVEKVDVRIGCRHVVMDRHHIDAIRPEGLQHGCDLRGQHRDVAGDDGLGITAVEGGPWTAA